MDVKHNVGSLTVAIAAEKISLAVQIATDEFQKQVTELLTQFSASQATSEKTLDMENTLFDSLQQLGLLLIQWVFSELEPELEQLPGTVKYQGDTFRRMADKTKRADIITRFGRISLERGRYRQGSAGQTIFPMEILLGIQQGFTPAAADRIGKQFAQTGSSQGRTQELVADQMGTSIGTEKLRKLVASMAAGMEPVRQEAQVQKLVGLIDIARGKNEKPVLSVSRDGVALGLAPWSCFEMASVACVSVLVAGHKLGTVYLGCTPETNQQTLSQQLTSLLKAVVRSCDSCVPEIVYVTDAGKIETAYWKNVMRKFYVDGKRIKITRVVDFYHAAERLTTIANALKFGKHTSQRARWLERVRQMLLERGGHGRVLRSMAIMRKLYGYKSWLKADAQQAEKYLRRYKRFMNYAALKTRDFPIGSGIVESACKQIVSERMKLSGMRWSKTGGQVAMTLRCILLSGIWDRVYKTCLQSKPTVEILTQSKAA